MRAGHTYANVHSTKWPGGEIRAQINDRRQPGRLTSSDREGGRARSPSGRVAGLDARDDGEPERRRAGAVDHAVVERDRDRSRVRRTTTAPSRTTARGATRPMLRIATSGWFTIGVWKRPASLPALVTVNVEPRSSSACKRSRAGTLCELGDLRRELVDALLVRAPDDRDDQAVVGLHCDADVVAVEVDDRVAVEPRVELRKLGEALGAGLDDRRAGVAREGRPRRRTPRPRSPAAPRGARASCARRSAAARRAAARDVLLRRLPAHGPADVLLRDPAPGPVAATAREVDPELRRDAADDGRRLHAPS